MLTNCQQCGAGFPAKTKRAKFCGPACRAKAFRATSGTAPRPAANGYTYPAGDVEMAVRAQIAAADAAPDAATAAALVTLARRLDAPTTPASAVPALHRELTTTLGRLSLHETPDAVDTARAAVAAKRERLRESRTAKAGADS